MATLTASFRGSNTAIVRGLCQYVGGQILKVTGIDLPAITKVYFSLTESEGASETRIGTTKDGVLSVAIPESMIMNDEMTSNYTIFAFIHADEDGDKVTYTVRMPVIAKPKPTDSLGYEDQAMLEQAIGLINEYNDKIDSMAEAVLDMERQTQEIQDIADEIRAISDGLPQWVKDGTKPNYTAEEIGADDRGAAEAVRIAAEQMVSAHNMSNSAHVDIRHITDEQATAIAGLRESISGFALSEDIPTALSELAEDSTHKVVTEEQISSWNSKTSFSGDYADLTNAPTIPVVPDRLPSPFKLKLTGAADGEYDGTEPVTIHVNGASIKKYREEMLDRVNRFDYSDVGGATELEISIDCPTQTYDANYVYLAINNLDSPVAIPLNPVSKTYDSHSWIWIKKVNGAWRVLYKQGSGVNFTTQNALSVGWWNGDIESISIRAGDNPFPQGTVFNIEGVLA